MRFALLEIKLTLVKILKNYLVLPSDLTPKKLEFKETIVVRRPIHEMHVVFKKRQD
jgi:hypothetical protein